VKWFNNLRVSVRLGTASGVIGALMLTVMFMAFQGEGRLNSASHQVRVAGTQLGASGDLRDAAYGLDAEQTSYSLDAVRGVKDATSSSGGRKEFLGEVAAFRDALAGASQIFTSPAGRADLEKLRTNFAEFLRLDSQIVADYRTGTSSGLLRGVNLATGQAADVVDSMRATADHMSTLADQASAKADASATAARSFSIRLILFVGAFALALGAVLMMLISRSISRPLGKAVDVLDKVAAGDLTTRLDVDSHDEIGQVASALNNSLERTAETMRAIRESSVTLASSSEELSATSAQLGSSAEETSAQASTASVTAEQVSSNVSAVASSSEEMAASIREIAASANEAAVVAAEAVMAAETTNSTVAKLGDSSAEIGEVIKVITSIAEQTNLLALNATIEAARAGEAGKGFAVVANEVKELAKQTAKATEEIGAKVTAIQSDAAAATDAIRRIGEVIGRINEIQGTIATAVEEQTSTTNEVTRNVTEAASGANDIASNIAGVAQAAQDSSAGASTTRAAASSLAQLAEELTRLVGQFVVDDGHVAHPGYEHGLGGHMLDDWAAGIELDPAGPGDDVAA